jgi:hypothetical protein
MLAEHGTPVSISCAAGRQHAQRNRVSLPPVRGTAMDRDENDMRDEAARPFCTNCGTAMWLQSRVATGPLSEVRQFKCPVCDRTQMVTIAEP